MKLAVLFIGDATQVVLTPEDDREKAIVELLRDGTVAVKRGSFFAKCKGDYYCDFGTPRRLNAYGYEGPSGTEDSVMLVIQPEPIGPVTVTQIEPKFSSEVE